MNNESESIVIDRERIIALSYFAFFLFMASFVPLFGNQMIAGPLVNAILFLVTFILGLKAGLLIAVIPSFIAVSMGLLPIILLPVVPFIIGGNMVLVAIFFHFKGKYWKGVILASIFKFLFLASLSTLVIQLVIKEPMSIMAGYMLTWPQLWNALLGGLIAYLILKVIRRI